MWQHMFSMPVMLTVWRRELKFKLIEVFLRRYFASSIPVATKSKPSVNLKFWDRHLHLINKRNLFMAQRPLVGQDLLIYRGLTITLRRTTVSRTPLEEWSARRIEATTWQHTRLKKTDSHAAGSIRTRNPSKRTAADRRLKPRGHWRVFKIIVEWRRSVGNRRKKLLGVAENYLKRRGLRRRKKMVRDRDSWKLNLKVGKVQYGL